MSPESRNPVAATTPEVERIRRLVHIIRSGEALHPRNEYENRLSLAVVRYVNELGPGDVPEEYAAVVEAMSEAPRERCMGDDGQGCFIPPADCICVREGTPGYRVKERPQKPTPTPAAGLLSVHTGTFKAGE